MTHLFLRSKDLLVAAISALIRGGRRLASSGKVYLLPFRVSVGDESRGLSPD